MSIREDRQIAAETIAADGLKNLGVAWVSARLLAEHTERPWRSTARALQRMVADGRVLQSLLIWRDPQYRPRARRIYQWADQDACSCWPAWMLGVPPPPATNRGTPNRPPKLSTGNNQENDR